MGKQKSIFVDKKNILGLLAILFLLLVGVALLVNVKKQQDVRRRAAPPTVNGVMRLNPSRTLTDLQVGTTFSIVVQVSSSTYPLYGVDVALGFDNSHLEVTDIQRGSGWGDGCVGQTNPVVLAPINSETDCNFKKTGVIGTANSTGRLEFGVVPFNWTASSNAAYRPTPMPVNATLFPVAVVSFRAKANTSGSVANGIRVIKVDTACPANRQPTDPDCRTTESNLAAISTDTTREVGDILGTVNNSPLAINISGTTSCDLHAQGDVNCDGYVNIADRNEVKRVMAGLASTIDTDVNGDGYTNIGDLNVIKVTMSQ